MNTRLLLVVAIIIVVAVAAVALLTLQSGPVTPAVVEGATRVVQNNTDNSPTPVLPTPTPIDFTEVVIAVQDIPRGVTIQPNMVSLINFPTASVPFGAFDNPEDVIGRIARADIAREQHILTSLVVDDFTALSPVGSDAAAVLPPNLVAIALPMDRQTSVAFAIQPGDRVDVIVSMLFVDVDPDFQSVLPNGFSLINTELVPIEGLEGQFRQELRFSAPSFGLPDTLTLPVPNQSGSVVEQPVAVLKEASEEQRPRLVTQRTVLDALVVWIGEFPRDGRIFNPAPTPTPVATPTPEGQEGTGAETSTSENAGPPTPTPVPPRPDIVTLAVQPQDAVILTYMAEAGFPLTFALRSAGSTTLQPTEPVTLDFILNRFNITVPERFNFAVEPAIRSIRELSLGNRIQLSGTDQTETTVTDGGSEQ